MSKVNTPSEGSETDEPDQYKYRNEVWLREQYVENQRSTTEIASELGVSKMTISRWLRKNDIDTRGPTEVTLSEEQLSSLRDESWVREKYEQEEEATHEIAGRLGVSHGTVIKWMQKHGIETREEDNINYSSDTEPLRNETWLRNEYVENNKSTIEIGDELGVSDTTVANWLDKHGIETRTQGEAQTEGNTDPLRDEEWLREEYVNKKKSTPEIGELLGVTCGAVGHWLYKHNIETRSQSEALTDGNVEPLKSESWLRVEYCKRDKTQAEIASDIGVTAPTVGNWLDRHGIGTESGGSMTATTTYRNEVWLREEYVENQRSTTEIASELGVSKMTISRWLRKNDIEARDRGHAQSVTLPESGDDVSPGNTYRNEAWMREQYVERDMTQREIASELGVSNATISRHLGKHGIQTR